MRLGTICALTFVVVLLGGSTSPAAAAPQVVATEEARPHAKQRAGYFCKSARRALAYYRIRYTTWLGMRDVRVTVRVGQPRGCGYVRWLIEVWRTRAYHARLGYQAHLRRERERARMLAMLGDQEAWECIHSKERGADRWQTNTGNGYYGGLQMDVDFQKAHGMDMLVKYGNYAHAWSREEQIMVAQRAKLGIRTSVDSRGRVYLWQDRPRGYNPWPNTARECGLL